MSRRSKFSASQTTSGQKSGAHIQPVSRPRSYAMMSIFWMAAPRLCIAMFVSSACRVAMEPSALPQLFARCIPGPRDEPGIYVRCAYLVTGLPGYLHEQVELPVEIRIVLPSLIVPFIYVSETYQKLYLAIRTAHLP